MSDLTLPLDAFIRAVGVDCQAPHAVFLGAGASISSGIPSASLCIWEWKRNIFLTNNPGVERQFSELTLRSIQERIQRWLDTKGMYPANGSPEEYSFYIEQCFPIGQHRRQFFVDKIRSAQPHVGYKLLCLLAETGIVRLSWTTNFDGLVAKAATGFNITPVEVGIDCQHRAVRQPRRGELLCVSLHGDYRYDELKNTDDELQQQEAQLKAALVTELQNTALIVLGYSGRDKSVMDALAAAYSRPGTAGLYWCGFEDEITEPVRQLLETARAAGRTVYFVPTMGFDDTLIRLALHCLSGDQQEGARRLLSEVSQELRGRNKPFAIDPAPCAALIKSNAFEIDYSSEVFTSDVRSWPEKPWDWLDRLSDGRRFVAVPHRKKVLALGLLDEIRDAFGEQLSSSIERTPITDADTNVEHGAVNALMRRALLQSIAEETGVATDGKYRLWETQAYERKQSGGQDCHIHREESSLELAQLITRAIDAVVAAEKPHLVLVFIPDRWATWRGYQDEYERFDLHDFVKAYCVQKGIATQFLEEHTFSSAQQCRVWWWLSVALYAKGMRTPWVLEALDPDTAFVGLGFTINQFAPKGQQVVLGCSHLYNAQGEGLQFRLSKVENPIIIRRNPHMSYEDARRVAETIRQLFFEAQFRLPPRVVVHKQTRFLDDEKKGLLDGLSGVGAVDLLEVNTDAALRYVSSVVKENGNFDEDNFPVRRGTVVQLDSRKALVWCHGVTDAVTQGWRYFQGKRHIPAPLLLRRHAGNADLESLAAEIFGLSKMDWNSADMYSKLPATIYSSKQIARIGAKLQRFGPVSYDYRLFM